MTLLPVNHCFHRIRIPVSYTHLFVFEAPIDLLSFICLYPQDWQTRSYLALGGVSGKALDRFLSERKDTQKVFLCLDSDTAGSEACTLSLIHIS